MRLFQNSGVYPTYLPILHSFNHINDGFDKRLNAFLNDRFGAPHFLEPILNSEPYAFFTNGDDHLLQKAWARENGMPPKTSLENILLAQIEAHNTEVFYNLDPMRYGTKFVRKLPGSVKKTIAWRAAPSPGADFTGYDVMLCNFLSILNDFRKQGLKAEYFTPAHDPVMDNYAKNTLRPIDVVFVGGYSRHHKKRAKVLEELASMKDDINIVFHLDQSRLTKLSEKPLGKLLPLSKHRRPMSIQTVGDNPVFGRELYSVLSKSKIVFNGAIDMAGLDKGNMRCFEAMGAGSLMVSDTGNYPEGMQHGKTILNYTNAKDAISIITKILDKPEELHKIAESGYKLVSEKYSKKNQWNNFIKIAENI